MISLALASKPQVLENCPVLVSRTAVFFKWLKFCRSPENFFEDLFFVESQKKNLKPFFSENASVCVLGPWPWPQAFLSLASRGFVLGRAVLGLGLFFAFLTLSSSLVSSTPPLFNMFQLTIKFHCLVLTIFQTFC